MGTVKSPQVQNWSPVRESDAGNVQCVIGYCPVNYAAWAQNDVIQMVKIPIGAVIIDVIFESNNLGSGVNFCVGDNNNVCQYISNTSGNAAGICQRKNAVLNVGVPIVFTNEDTIDVKLSAGNPTDNVQISLYVLYVCGVDVTP